MKLIGTKKNGRRVASRKAAAPYKTQKKTDVRPDAKQGVRQEAQASRRKTRVRIIVSAITFAALAGCLVLANYVMTSIKPPPVKTSRPISTNTPPAQTSAPPGGSETPDPEDNLPEGTSPATEFGRKENQFTFVILGLSGGNTDTMMVANFDAKNYKLDVVSIPRDTLVNVSWNTKKANSLYAYRGVDGVLSGMVDLLGFEVDFYVVVDLKAFSTLVDAVGGVWFDVPKDMYYKAEDITINLKKGYQLLDGQKALQLVRCRNVYSNADIGRIGTQQEFLKAAAQQILEKQKEINLVDLANIFLKYVKTDLTYGNLIWFAKEFYKMDGENIRFATLPADYYDHVNGVSYVTIYPREWVKMINERLNPFLDDIALMSCPSSHVTQTGNSTSQTACGRATHGGAQAAVRAASNSGSGGSSGRQQFSGFGAIPAQLRSPLDGNSGSVADRHPTTAPAEAAPAAINPEPATRAAARRRAPGRMRTSEPDWGDIENPHLYPDGPPEDWEIDSFD